MDNYKVNYISCALFHREGIPTNHRSCLDMSRGIFIAMGKLNDIGYQWMLRYGELLPHVTEVED